ncbi:MAG TPA: PH domain-containing protein [Patescibacteria group bacterium]|nr:PH domain-containing protein [Patescibacteria group bacterium]
MMNLKHLPNCEPDEKVAFLLRRHPITLTGLIFSYLAVIILPFLIYGYLRLAQPTVLESPVWHPILVLLGSFLFLYVWLFLFQSFMDYHLDVWVVTSARILNIKQTGLFSRRVSEVRLYRVQDVTATVSGAGQTLFDYGDIEIQTAGEHERFTVERIPHPNRVTKTILELAELDRKNHLEAAVEEFETPDRKNNT